MTPLSNCRSSWRNGRLTALLVVATGIALSVATWFFTRSVVERDAHFKFQAATIAAAAEAQQHIGSYADMLYGLQGLFQAESAVSRAAFDRYVRSLNLPLRYPGVRSVSYARRVPASAKAEFARQLRRDAELIRRGIGDVAIKPAGERSEYVVLTYTEPLHSGKAALGFDLASDRQRMAMIERARDSGTPVLSERVALATGPAQGDLGVVMRLALYRKDAFTPDVERRREAFSGLIDVTFRVEELAQSMLSGEDYGKFTLRIRDAGYVDGDTQPAAEELYSNAAFRPPPTGAEFQDSRYIDVSQRRWELTFSAPREHFLRATDHVLPWAASLSVLVVSLLLSGLIRSLAGSRQRARTLAAQMTADLLENRTRLAEEQRRTQELIEVLPNPVFFKGTNGRYLGVNRAWESFFGTPRDGFVGKTVFDLYPDRPDIAERLHADDQELWDHPGSKTYETSITTGDGKRHDAVYFKATFAHADGRVAGLIGTIVDITERKRAQETNARLAAIVDGSNDAIIGRSLDRKILSWNAAAQRLFGYTAAEAIGQSISLIIPPEREEESAHNRVMLEQGVTFVDYETERMAKDGRRIPVSLSQSPFKDEHGVMTGVAIIVRDIRERKQMEDRQAMEHTVTRILADAETLAETSPRIIQTICETMGWDCGARWQADRETGVLRCIDCWGVDTPGIQEFMTGNSKWAIDPESPSGQGLVRRIHNSGQPHWIADVAQEPNLLRAPMVVRAGLHGAFGFPLVAGGEVLGLMEFFHRDVREPDAVLLRMAESIGNQIGQFMARKQAEERVSHLAKYDELTGLPNRSMFHERLHHALAQAKRHTRPLAVMFIDLDRFKNVNDTLGHEAGDQVLREVAERLRRCLRDSDTVGRLGGDEFVVLIEDLPQPADAAVVAKRILEAVAAPFILAAREFHLGASIGISAFPGDGDDLLKNADAAMYRAKEQGRNNYQYYSTQMNVHTLDRLEMESDLRRAVAHKEFVLHYQPKINIVSGCITGMEALLRWQHPAKGLVPPMQFVPLAEETGLIVPIGNWVLRTACAQNKFWQEQGLPPMRVAVNLSARQFAHENLLQDVASVLGETALDPALLEFEITESMVMKDPVHAVKLLTGFKAMGIHLSIDDFGTGYSSLSYLKRFPIDSVKIDRSFIRDLPEDTDDAAITQAILAMAHSLKLNVVAEGVETQEQLRFLGDYGCNEMQGYYFSKPVPAHEFARLATNGAASGKPAEVAAIGLEAPVVMNELFLKRA